MTTKAKLPKGYRNTNSPSNLWRVGFAFHPAPGFGDQYTLQETGLISIRPGETGLQAYRREGGKERPGTMILEPDGF